MTMDEHHADKFHKAVGADKVFCAFDWDTLFYGKQSWEEFLYSFLCQ